MAARSNQIKAQNAAMGLPPGESVRRQGRIVRTQLAAQRKYAVHIVSDTDPRFEALSAQPIAQREACAA
jgi:hypothetical protein